MLSFKLEYWENVWIPCDIIWYNKGHFLVEYIHPYRQMSVRELVLEHLVDWDYTW